MKAETKAKRRVTLSLVGLGMLDETETVTIPDAVTVTVNPTTGEIEEPTDEPKAPKDEIAEFIASLKAQGLGFDAVQGFIGKRPSTSNIIAYCNAEDLSLSAASRSHGARQGPFDRAR